MYSHKAIIVALRTHLVTLDGLPAEAYRAWINVKFEPTPGQAFLEEEYLPGPQALDSMPADGGLGELLPQYVLRWYFPQKTGFTAMFGAIDALLAHFAIGTVLTDASENRIRVRERPAPYASTPIVIKAGWMTSTITIPLRVHFRNVVAA
jgi:hypothetical protein